MNYAEMARNGVGSSDIDLSDYRHWLMTKAQCDYCGKMYRDEPWHYGLAERKDSDWWVTEVDCGCRFRRLTD